MLRQYRAGWQFGVWGHAQRQDPERTFGRRRYQDGYLQAYKMIVGRVESACPTTTARYNEASTEWENSLRLKCDTIGRLRKSKKFTRCRCWS